MTANPVGDFHPTLTQISSSKKKEVRSSLESLIQLCALLYNLMRNIDQYVTVQPRVPKLTAVIGSTAVELLVKLTVRVGGFPARFEFNKL